MNTQGFSPINDSTISQLESFQSTPDAAQSKFSKLIEEKLPIDGNSLGKCRLFSCHKCDGAIVPSTQCPVCNRTSFRKCTKCGNEIPNGSHQQCEFLVLLSQVRGGGKLNVKN